MKTLRVGEFKAQFASVVEEVKQGKEVFLAYGKNDTPMAVLVPFQKYQAANPIKLGLLEGKAQVNFSPEFKMSGEELLELP